jgi:hypothetical protein
MGLAARFSLPPTAWRIIGPARISFRLSLWASSPRGAGPIGETLEWPATLTRTRAPGHDRPEPRGWSHETAHWRRGKLDGSSPKGRRAPEDGTSQDRTNENGSQEDCAAQDGTPQEDGPPEDRAAQDRPAQAGPPQEDGAPQEDGPPEDRAPQDRAAQAGPPQEDDTQKEHEQPDLEPQIGSREVHGSGERP